MNVRTLAISNAVPAKCNGAGRGCHIHHNAPLYLGTVKPMYNLGVLSMTIQEYIDSVSRRYASGITTEHSFRGDLQSLLESLLPDVTATN